MDTSPLQNPTKPCRANGRNLENFRLMGPLNNIIIERETTLYLNLWLMIHVGNFLLEYSQEEKAQLIELM